MPMAAANPGAGRTTPRAPARSRLGPLTAARAKTPPCDQPTMATRSGRTNGWAWRKRSAPMASSKRAVFARSALPVSSARQSPRESAASQSCRPRGRRIPDRPASAPSARSAARRRVAVPCIEGRRRAGRRSSARWGRNDVAPRGCAGAGPGWRSGSSTRPPHPAAGKRDPSRRYQETETATPGARPEHTPSERSAPGAPDSRSSGDRERRGA